MHIIETVFWFSSFRIVRKKKFLMIVCDIWYLCCVVILTKFQSTRRPTHHVTWWTIAKHFSYKCLPQLFGDSSTFFCFFFVCGSIRFLLWFSSKVLGECLLSSSSPHFLKFFIPSWWTITLAPIGAFSTVLLMQRWGQFYSNKTKSIDIYLLIFY